MSNKSPIHHDGLLNKIFGEYDECPDCGNKLIKTETFEENLDSVHGGRWIHSYYVCNKCKYTYGDDPNKEIKIGVRVKYESKDKKDNIEGIVINRREVIQFGRTHIMMDIKTDNGKMRSIEKGLLIRIW